MGGTMTNPNVPRPNPKRDEWVEWARRNVDGDEQAIQRAADAALRSLRAGATANQAADTARAAAADPTPPQDLHRAQTESEPQVAPSVDVNAPPGTIVGRAKRVSKQQQLASGGSIQTLEFQLCPPDGAPPVLVQMRGILLEGGILDGDLVQVPSATGNSGFIETDYAYNLTRDTAVQMRKGITGAIGLSDATIGRRWTTAKFVVAGVVLCGFFVVAAVVAIFFFTAAPRVGDQIRQDQQEHQEVKADWCRSARDAGMELPHVCDGLI